MRYRSQDGDLDPQNGGYLIGDLGTKKLRPGLLTDVLITIGNHCSNETLHVQRAPVEISPNQWFSGLREIAVLNTLLATLTDRYFAIYMSK